MKYRHAKWNYLWPLFGCCLAIFFGVINLFFPKSDLGSWVMYLSVSLIFMVLSGLSLWKTKTAYVLVENRVLYLKDGFKRQEVDLHNVKSVIVKGGYVILDEGKIPRVIIPRIFSDMKGLVEAIRAEMGEENK